MENPRSEKVEIVEEVKARLEAADAVVLTEYRGLKVSELEALRKSMRAAGGDYRVYKNTLVRFAARELELDLDAQLTGPTGIAFITSTEETQGDIAAVAKALTDFAKSNPLLVVKGGVLGENVLDAAGAKALASLPTAAEIYARIAGGLNSGARGLASVVSGVHRSIAYVLQAAIDAGAFAGDAPAPAPTSEASADEEPSTEDVTAEAPAEVEAEAAEATESENAEQESTEEA